MSRVHRGLGPGVQLDGPNFGLQRLGFARQSVWSRPMHMSIGGGLQRKLQALFTQVNDSGKQAGTIIDWP